MSGNMRFARTDSRGRRATIARKNGLPVTFRRPNARYWREPNRLSIAGVVPSTSTRSSARSAGSLERSQRVMPAVPGQVELEPFPAESASKGVTPSSARPPRPGHAPWRPMLLLFGAHPQDLARARGCRRDRTASNDSASSPNAAMSPSRASRTEVPCPLDGSAVRVCSAYVPATGDQLAADLTRRAADVEQATRRLAQLAERRPAHSLTNVRARILDRLMPCFTVSAGVVLSDLRLREIRNRHAEDASTNSRTSKTPSWPN